MTRHSLGGLAALGLLIGAGCGRYDFDEQAPEETGAPQISYPAALHAILGKTELAAKPRVVGTGLTFSVSPQLPAGASLDAATGKISGVPTAIEDRGLHVITATNGAGSVTATIYVTSLTGVVVDTLLDGMDDTDGMDPTCRSTVAGGCTLRAAFDTANHLPGEKQLVLAPAGTYQLTRSLPGLKKHIVIAGAGAGETIIRSATEHGGYPMIYVDNRLSLRLETLGVRDFSSSDGGALRVSNGKLEVFAAAFENNQADGNRGGVMAIDGGASALFEDTTFTGNRAIAGNGWGGVINGAGIRTEVTVRRSTATRNLAQWGSFSHFETGASLLLENSTLTINQALTAGTLASPGGEVTLINDTIVHNTVTASDSAGLYLHGPPARFKMANTLVAYNLDRDGRQNNCHRREDLASVVISTGGNLFGDGAGNCADALTATDVANGELKLDDQGLMDHGGLTPTIALQPGSAAIDLGVTSCPKEDQRGVARSGARCDAGAFELP
jgi:hypothetical protein